MELLLNDLSLHGQFPNAITFQESLAEILAMREIARRFHRELHVHRNVLGCCVTPDTSVNKVLHNLPSRDAKVSVLRWFTGQGPFWDDDEKHDPDDYLECNGDLVTGTAVSEVAYRALPGDDSRLISFAPSNWQVSPLTVVSKSGTGVCVDIWNYWHRLALETALRDAEPPVSSWQQLEMLARSRFQLLTFPAYCFEPLAGQPFARGAVGQIIKRLDVLNQIAGETNSTGQRTPEGHRLYRDHFTGDRAWFSDSSDTEKTEFRRQLTFPHPERPGDHLFCPWHGKVNTPKLRIHFGWPERPGTPLYVTYIGLKITRR